MEDKINRPQLFELINQAFNDDGLQVLCFQHFPEVKNNFTLGQSKSQRVLALIDHCERNLILPNLLKVIDKEYPAMYAQYKGKLFEESKPERSESEPSTSSGNQTIIQKADKIYNIKNIDKADFS